MKRIKIFVTEALVIIDKDSYLYLVKLFFELRKQLDFPLYSFHFVLSSDGVIA